jgi:hypothetical protein
MDPLMTDLPTYGSAAQASQSDPTWFFILMGVYALIAVALIVLIAKIDRPEKPKSTT